MPFSIRVANSRRHTPVNTGTNINTTNRIVFTNDRHHQHRRITPANESQAMTRTGAIRNEGKHCFTLFDRAILMLTVALGKRKHPHKRNPRYPVPTASPARSLPFAERKRRLVTTQTQVELFVDFELSFIRIGF